MRAIHLGSGIVKFPGAFKIDNHELSIVKNACQKDGQFQEINGVIRNNGGYEFDEITAKQAPSRFPDLESLGLGWLRARLRTAAQETLIKYLSAFPCAIECINTLTDGYIIRYGNGQSIGPHSDNAMAYANGLVINDSPPANTLTVGIMLNDDYTGGLLKFPLFGIIARTNAGDVMIYPSSFVGCHQVEEIIDGERYAYVMWFSQNPMVGDSYQKQLRETIKYPANNLVMVGEF